VYQELAHGSCKALGLGFAQVACTAVYDGLPWATAVAGNDRSSARHGLKGHDPEVLVGRGVQQCCA